MLHRGILRTSFHGYHIDFSHLQSFLILAPLDSCLLYSPLRCTVLPVARWQVPLECIGTALLSLLIRILEVRVYIIQSWQMRLAMSNRTLRTLLCWVQVIDVNANSTVQNYSLQINNICSSANQPTAQLCWKSK